MTLKEYCYDVLIEMRKEQEYNVDNVVDYVTEKAQEYLNNENGAVDDETIKKWVMEYDPSKVSESLGTKEVKIEEKPKKKISEMSLDEAIANAKEEHKPKKKEVSGSWGTMESLF